MQHPFSLLRAEWYSFFSKRKPRSNDLDISKEINCNFILIFLVNLLSDAIINVSTELEMTSDARQNGGKTRYVKPLQVRVSSDNKKIQSSDWPKWRCTLWRSVNSRILSGIERHFRRSVDTLIMHIQNQYILLFMFFT